MTHKKRKMVSVAAMMAFGAVPALTMPGGCAVAGPLVVPGADEVARQSYLDRAAAPAASEAPSASASGFVTGSASSASTALADPVAPSPVDGAAPAPMPVDGAAPAPQPEQQAAVKFTEAQLKEMVGPIALYPDPLLAQVFAASTYPLDIVRAARFVKTNANDPQLKEKIAAEGWDPSVQALAHYPNVLAMMDENLDWTQNLGVAFVNQQDEVLAAVQLCRAQAQSAGNLATNQQQKVVVEEKIIQIVPADPQIIYVPQYVPEVVYVERPYYVESVISFGIGYGVGSWLDLDCDWRHRRVCYGGWYSKHHHHKHDHGHKGHDHKDNDHRDGRGNWNNGRDSHGTTVRRDDQRDNRNDRDSASRNDGNRASDGRLAGNRREGEAWHRDTTRAPQVRPSSASAVAAVTLRRTDNSDRSPRNVENRGGDNRDNRGGVDVVRPSNPRNNSSDRDSTVRNDGPSRFGPREGTPVTGNVRDVVGVNRSLAGTPAASAQPNLPGRFDPDARRSDRDRNSDDDVLRPRLRPAQSGDRPSLIPTPAANNPVPRSIERPARAPESVVLPGPVRSSEIRSTVEPREAPALRPTTAPAPRTITNGVGDRPAPGFERSAVRPPVRSVEPRVSTPAPIKAPSAVRSPAPTVREAPAVRESRPAPTVKSPSRADTRASEARQRANTAREIQKRRG